MRKALSTRTRFEIFKRDEFTCAYCGGTPPAVVLHCDHILAVANGGGNEPENLITSCSSCNLGKSDVPLERVSAPLSEVFKRNQESAEQLKEYEKFLTERRAENEVRFNAVSQFLLNLWEVENAEGQVVCGVYEESIRMFLKRMPAQEIMECLEVAHAKRFNRERSTHKYFCGCCWRRIKGPKQA
jgi:hypothetical protein